MPPKKGTAAPRKRRNTTADNSSDPPAKKVKSTSSQPKIAIYVYVVLKANLSNWMPYTWEIRGTYSSLTDANNKIMELCEEECSTQEFSMQGMEEGRRWWKEPGFKGGEIRVWCEKRMVEEDSGAKERQWEKEKPGLEGHIEDDLGP